MGIFKFSDYAKEGKGVEKDAPAKRSFFAFFELLFRKIGKLCMLNVVYLTTTVPVMIAMFFLASIISAPVLNMISPVLARVLEVGVTDESFLWYLGIIDIAVRVLSCLLFVILWGAGPVTAGYTYVLRNYANETHAWMWSDFWEYTKENFKQSLVVLIVDVIAFIVMFYAYIFYDMLGGVMSNLKYFVVVAIIFYTMAHFYIYQMMITFKLKLKDIYKNAFLFVLLKLPNNLLILAILALVHIGIPWFGLRIAWLGGSIVFWAIYVMLELFILVGLSGFLVNFFVSPNIKKYMIDIIEQDEK